MSNTNNTQQTTCTPDQLRQSIKALTDLVNNPDVLRRVALILHRSYNKA